MLLFDRLRSRRDLLSLVRDTENTIRSEANKSPSGAAAQWLTHQHFLIGIDPAHRREAGPATQICISISPHLFEFMYENEIEVKNIRHRFSVCVEISVGELQ